MRPVPVEQTQGMNWPVLQPVNGDAEAHGIALTKPVCIAGSRQGRVHLPLTAPTVSRTHALFVWGEHGVWLHDLASRNHVYVNDQPVRHTLLGDGDVVRIGPHTFSCQSGFSRDGAGNGRATPAALTTTHDHTVIRLSGPATVIGSRENCDVVLADDNVESVHAVIYELDGRRMLRDLGSTTGTFVNDRPVGQVGLESSDRIRIGGVEFSYDEGEQFAEAESQTAAESEAPAQSQTAESDVIPLQEEPEQAAAEPAPAAAEDKAAEAPAAAAASEPAPAIDPLDDVIPLLDDPVLASPGAEPAQQPAPSVKEEENVQEEAGSDSAKEIDSGEEIALREDPELEDAAAKPTPKPPARASARPAGSHPGAQKRAAPKEEEDPFDQLLDELERGDESTGSIESHPGERSAGSDKARKTRPAAVTGRGNT